MIRRPVGAPGLVGTVFAPSEVARPGVIVLPGSEGGVPEPTAELLAETGRFTVLALAYFGRPGLPRRLREVPVEIVEDAARWLQAQALTRPGPIGIVGASKGAELALVAAAVTPDRLGPVVAIAPSSVVWAGVEFLALDKRLLAGVFGTASRRSSWTHKGDTLPFLHHAPGVLPRLSRHGISVSPSFEIALRDDEAAEAAAIPVERCRGPILLASGDDDRMWPATLMANAIVDRMNEHGRRCSVEHLRFHGAGHRLGPRTAPRGLQRLARIIDYGGHPISDERARSVLWKRSVEFLATNLGA